MRAHFLDALRSRDGKRCAIELDFHKLLPDLLCLRMTVVPPRHRVSSQFSSDFYNVNHILCPGPGSHFCSAWEHYSTYLYAPAKERDVNVGRTRILVIQIDSCIQHSARGVE